MNIRIRAFFFLFFIVMPPLKAAQPMTDLLLNLKKAELQGKKHAAACWPFVQKQELSVQDFFTRRSRHCITVAENQFKNVFVGHQNVGFASEYSAFETYYTIEPAHPIHALIEKCRSGMGINQKITVFGVDNNELNAKCRGFEIIVSRQALKTSKKIQMAMIAHEMGHAKQYQNGTLKTFPHAFDILQFGSTNPELVKSASILSHLIEYDADLMAALLGVTFGQALIDFLQKRALEPVENHYSPYSTHPSQFDRIFFISRITELMRLQEQTLPIAKALRLNKAISHKEEQQ